jgi:hypothetical protein
MGIAHLILVRAQGVSKSGLPPVSATFAGAFFISNIFLLSCYTPSFSSLWLLHSLMGIAQFAFIRERCPTVDLIAFSRYRAFALPFSFDGFSMVGFFSLELLGRGISGFLVKILSILTFPSNNLEFRQSLGLEKRRFSPWWVQSHSLSSIRSVLTGWLIALVSTPGSDHGTGTWCSLQRN